MPDRAHKRRRLSLRLKLTLWVIAIFLVIQISLSLVLLLYEQASIDRFFTGRLETRTTALAHRMAVRTEPIDDEWLAELAAEQLDFVAFERFALTVYDADSRIVASSQEGTTSARLLQSLGANKPVLLRLPLATLEDPDPAAHQTRAALHPFRGADDKRYTLVALTSDTYARQLFATASNVLMVMIPIGTIAAGLAGWFIAGLAVAPIVRLQDIAGQLSPQSIDQEVDLSARTTEFAELEHELDDARKRIQAAFRAQERFISNVSHELKTPIAVVSAEAQVLRIDEDAPEEVREFVASVRDEMRRLGAMVNSFLLLTRVREGRAETISQRCPVNDLIMETVDDCATWAHQHRVHLAPALLEEVETLDTFLLGDPHLLRTLLDNLVFNAIRFSPEGQRVEIRASIEDGDVAIAVRDYGPGIPAELIDHVFDRFSQSAGEQRRGRGHGLGLEIAQGIAELHAGAISVRNLEDGGCEFTARLPIERPSAPVEEEEELEEPLREAPLVRPPDEADAGP